MIGKHLIACQVRPTWWAARRAAAALVPNPRRSARAATPAQRHPTGRPARGVKQHDFHRRIEADGRCILARQDFSIISVIGIILLIDIVKQNAIMEVDVALEARQRGVTDAVDAIRHACRLRLRPILMTTAATLLGALPLALSHGAGSEIRAPVGIALIGGLLVSQLLTLFTTPVVYLYLDRAAARGRSRWARALGGGATG